MTARRKRRSYSTGDRRLDSLVEKLIADSGISDNADLLKEIIITVFKLHDAHLDRGDVKLLNTAFKELRYAFNIFQPYRHVRKVAIFGSARTAKSSPEYKQARIFAEEIVKSGWMVITGAATGIMCAGNEGAGRSASFGANIRLPFEQEANPVIADDPKLINFKYFFTRKLIFIKESDATILCPGGFGTHDEGFETLTLVQTGKTHPRPIVCLDSPRSKYWSSLKKWMEKSLAGNGMIDPEDIHLIDFTHDPIEAADIVRRFYRTYHSSRFIGDLLVLRLKRPLTDRQVKKLNAGFKDILKSGAIEQRFGPFPEESNEPPELLDLPRLCLCFTRKHFARLKRLIETVNDF